METVVKHCNRLPREMAEFLEVFKRREDVAQKDLI